MPSLYERDFYGWANEQAALLRAGQMAALDIEHIAEEIASLGRSENRELVSRLAVLLTHLLKWEFQPKNRGRSWQVAIREQRRRLASHLRDNPSLKSKLPEAVVDAYASAVDLAGLETALPESAFPATCPYPTAEILSADFWPD